MKKAVILMNLGTPSEPTPAGERSFLKAFLSDRRVVEIPRPLWWVILNAFVLTLRPKKVAPAYEEIWSSGDFEGSPIFYYTREQAAALGKLLSAESDAGEGKDARVTFAMTYGEPGLQSTVAQLRDEGVEQFLVLPLYPQYSCTTTAPIYDQVAALFTGSRNVPDIRIVNNYHDHPLYIEALASSVREHWAQNGRSERLLVSYHGIPRSYVDKGDPYLEHCRRTSELLAEALELQPDEWAMSFQSRFGKAEWLKPYTSELLKTWGREGVSSVEVICPAFASDCLETLEEIAEENCAYFLESGGKGFSYIPCLNLRQDHINLLRAVVRENGFA